MLSTFISLLLLTLMGQGILNMLDLRFRLWDLSETLWKMTRDANDDFLKIFPQSRSEKEKYFFEYQT